MSGVEIAGALLADDAKFGSLVPEDQWDYWDLPQGTGLPNVVLTRPSRTKQQLLDAAPGRMVTERIQATVRASSAAEREAIILAIESACEDKSGTIGGFSNAAVLLAGTGPDFKDADAAIYIGSTDLRVSFTQPA